MSGLGDAASTVISYGEHVSISEGPRIATGLRGRNAAGASTVTVTVGDAVDTRLADFKTLDWRVRRSPGTIVADGPKISVR